MAYVKKTKNPNLAGPRRLQLDEETIYELASRFTSNKDIAKLLRCSPDLLEMRYLEAIHRGRADACHKIRTRQFEVAMSGNAQMLIWLGKNYCDQREPRSEDLDKVIQEIKVSLHPSIIPKVQDDNKHPDRLPSSTVAGELRTGDEDKEKGISAVG